MSLKEVFILFFVIFSLDMCSGNRIKRETLSVQNVCKSTYNNYEQPYYSSNKINVGECLSAGRELKNGDYRLIMQEDGNLVLYKSGSSIWRTHSHRSSADRFCLQDNQWALCKGQQTVVLFWQKLNTISYAKLQNDGNFVAYSSGDTALWSTDTF